MSNLQYNFPTFYRHEAGLDVAAKRAFQVFARSIEKMYNVIVEAVNSKQNKFTYVSQNDQPTPDDGEIILWEDVDATSSNPTHYLVVRSGATTVTFASVETVP